MMSITRLVAPENSPAQAAAFRACGQVFMRANYTPRCALEMKPGEVTRKSAYERLKKGETHHEQSRRHRIESRFNVRSHHVGERDRQRPAKHQIRHDSETR